MTNYETPKLVKRKIREYVKNILLDKTPARERVRIGRSVPTQAEDLPTLLVYTQGETVSRFDEAPKSYRRNMNLVIECLEAGDTDDDLDSRLEELGEKVEELIEADETFGGLINKVELSSTSYQTEPDGQSPIGSLVLGFNVDFFTFPKAHEAIDDFKRADVDWKVGHHNASPDAVVDAEDQIDVETT